MHSRSHRIRPPAAPPFARAAGRGRRRGPRPGRGHRHGGGRARRGDVRSALLVLLQEEPMHGYQMIQELEARTDGAWRPSPGSVYPTLQLLEDEGLVSVDSREGRKVFSLTDKGTGAATGTVGDDGATPWDEMTADSGPHALRKEVHRLVGAARQAGASGSAELVEKTSEIVSDARKKIYSLLADD